MKILSGIFGALAIAAITTGFSFKGGVMDNMVCAGGVKFMQEQKVPGPIFNILKWGGYISFMTDGKYQIFIDGRGYVHRRILKDYLRIAYGDRPALKMLEQYKVNALFLSPIKNKRLIETLLTSKQWALIYWDGFCQLYLKRIPANQIWLNRFACEHFNPMQETYLLPAHQAGAAQELRRTIEYDSGNHHAYYFLGDIYLTQKKYIQAEEVLEKSVDLYDNMVNSLFVLGKTKFFLKKYQEALALLWRAYRKADYIYKAESLFFISACYFELGRKSLGIKCGKKAIKINPKDKRYRIGLKRYLTRIKE